MIAEFDECPECGTGPRVHVVRDKPLNCAVRFRCGCGMIEHIIPYGIGMDVLQEIWNDYVRQHIRDRVQSAMVDAIGRQFYEGREVGLCEATNPISSPRPTRICSECLHCSYTPGNKHAVCDLDGKHVGAFDSCDNWEARLPQDNSAMVERLKITGNNGTYGKDWMEL